jgi:hypothetical protein
MDYEPISDEAEAVLANASRAMKKRVKRVLHTALADGPLDREEIRLLCQAEHISPTALYFGRIEARVDIVGNQWMLGGSDG